MVLVRVFQAISFLLACYSATPFNPLVGRRKAFVKTGQVAIVSASTAAFPIPPPASAETKSIAARFDNDSITIPPPSYSPEFNGIDNLYFPSWMAAEWSVVQTLVNTEAPLGVKFLGGPNGVEKIGIESLNEARTQIDKPVSFKLRYIPTKWGVAEDRLFNTRQRLDAFAGRSVVANVQYADVGGSNRPAVLAMGGTSEDPLQTTLTYFKGPAAQKTFVVSHGSETLSDNSWAGYEVDRSIFALTNENTAPPLTTDSELIWVFTRINENSIRAKLRIAGYLNAQSDTLYFDARKRAVSLQDYSLEFTR
mmetsp:Transcript_22390/g.33085  ORF Transcript_22390/g.33085 Transcript_22390/m.33085 type:complete len:308 (+) Transcript_22390:73-996(+)|eukprot:CAMPEP_0194203378 /NCGR_PEP_ID=MMETSP0156-20130528/3183_1 /TAXON_ID=33649 /ORGANISM="Thalassionema nitzschioides, Strain L26-B" /LENGTH=307 /DNA_ID=CAMNT_0038929125 /DNA_START=26 /DNA_END=949 /DNA_ORIENTATION=-